MDWGFCAGMSLVLVVGRVQGTENASGSIHRNDPSPCRKNLVFRGGHLAEATANVLGDSRLDLDGCLFRRTDRYCDLPGPHGSFAQEKGRDPSWSSESWKLPDLVHSISIKDDACYRDILTDFATLDFRPLQVIHGGLCISSGVILDETVSRLE